MGRRSETRALFVSGFLLPILLFNLFLLSVPAQAHTATGTGGYYNIRWKTDFTIKWRFTAEFPGGAYRDKVHYGLGQWNNQNQPLQWIEYTPDYANYGWNTCPSTEQKDGIHWENISGALARVRTCVFTSNTSRLYNVQMVFDSSGVNWYTGSGTPASNQFDLWSVATHEWGHMSGSLTNGDGLGHFPEGDSACPEDPNRNAMCPSTIAGTIWSWNTKTHDEHTFQAAY